MYDSKVFRKTYNHYLNQIIKLDLNSIKEKLNIGFEGNHAIIPFFGHPYRVSRNGIKDPSGKQASLDICVVLCRYLMMCPSKTPAVTDWVSFRDLRDSGPLTSYFENDVQNPISHFFSKKLDDLMIASKSLGGRSPNINLDYDVTLQFDALPKIPLLFLFNDADEEFPSQCSVLFDKSAESYLDAECLAILGNIFWRYLKKPPLHYK